MTSSGDNILNRLNSAVKPDATSLPEEKKWMPAELGKIEKIEALKSRMEAVRTEVHVIDSAKWVNSLFSIIKGKGLKDLLYSPGTDVGKELEENWEKNINGLPELIPFSEDIDSFKPGLFKTDASITTAKCAAADPGAIILWPDKNEPRTMSLVPPVHFAILKKEKIYNSLAEAINKEAWSESMPANVLLISGPSKTADIELTLAYGVHGPKQLILLII